MQNKIIFVRNLGLQNWFETYTKMNHFTKLRNFTTFDEIWFVEHYPIFTQGRLHKKENVIVHNDIPIINTDRGGQITYHGPGQQILYFLIDLKRRKINIRALIDIMQNTVIETLNEFFVPSYVKQKSPGVFVNNKKICSLGLRIKKGATLHGLALNVNMDLRPFNYIYPCGDANLKMTQIKEFNVYIKLKEIRTVLIKKLSKFFKVPVIYHELKKK